MSVIFSISLGIKCRSGKWIDSIGRKFYAPRGLCKSQAVTEEGLTFSFS